MPRPKSRIEIESIRRMIHQHLQRRSLLAQPAGEHLDEDALTAFVEGRLNDVESSGIISHLVDCGFCRQISARLVRLDFDIGSEQVPASELPAEPGRIRRLLDDLASRLAPQSEDNAVLAYHAPADDLEKLERNREKTQTSPEEPDGGKDDSTP